MRLLLSGYGGGDTVSAAVYDTEEGRFLWETHEPSCSYLCRYQDLLFGVTEGTERSRAYLYKGDEVDAKNIPGDELCHIAFIPERKLLVGACYGTGELVSMRVDTKRGMLLSPVRRYPQGGKAHCAVPYRSMLYSANIEQDRVYRYSVEPGGLRLLDFMRLPEGTGPRHILPKGGSLYVVSEYSNEVFRLYEGAVTQKVSILPPGYSGKAAGSTLCMTKDGKHLYAAARGADSVACFPVNSNGVLGEASFYSCGGNGPRHIALCGGDNVLAAANQQSGEITLLARDGETGALSEPSARIPFLKPSFVQELA